ncbi:MAG: leucyl/phenylalanyl-tRNA--protein transferase [Chitinophagaceae bacterium]|nr:leucyl/phenylalanyl-tRNA--protein transferase [Chitinophagaceae bacterium]
MSVAVLDNKLWFPKPDEALSDGLLAIGGDISVERLLLAYKNGIFPWYDGDLPLWWHPNPRFVLFPEEIKISKSLLSSLKKNQFQFKVNTAFVDVITHCKNISRPSQDGTWINDEFIKVYHQLHEKGIAHSAEAWLNNELVGGLYGIKMGNIFFGESMFSKVSNASKFAFAKYVEQLKNEGIALIDCQVYTEHLESFGARMISREEFMRLLLVVSC